MTAKIPPQPGILDIELYVGGASHVPGLDNVIKLSSNENPFGASDAAKAAIVTSAHQIHRYPTTDHGPLRHAISDVHGLNVDQIICGVGSDEVLTLLCQAYAGPGDEVIYTEHGFSLYPILVQGVGATPVKVAERDRQVDVDAIIAAANDQTRIVFLTNPGNPTATMIPMSEVTRLAEGLPDACLLVMDGAYVEYVGNFDGGASLVEARDDVVMTRTFSKIYGLGGMRVGWGYGPQHVIDVLNRIRAPFNMSNTALAAAEAAVRDQEYVEKCRSENARMRDWMGHALAEIGVQSDASCTNFILARFGSADEANGCEEHLRSKGLLVRKTAGYGLPNCLRITIGDEPSCRQVVAAIRDFKGADT